MLVLVRHPESCDKITFWPVEVEIAPEGIEDVKRHFDVVAEVLLGKLAPVAEGQQLLAEGQHKLDERFGGLERRIDRLEGEIKAMLRLSFVELERRVLALETAVTGLAGRVERLEGPHSQ